MHVETYDTRSNGSPVENVKNAQKTPRTSEKKIFKWIQKEHRIVVNVQKTMVVSMFLLYPFKYCVFGIVNHVHIYSMKYIKI